MAFSFNDNKKKKETIINLEIEETPYRKASQTKNTAAIGAGVKRSQKEPFSFTRSGENRKQLESAEGWYQVGNDLLREMQTFYSQPHTPNSRMYDGFRSRADKLLASAGSWRKQLSGNQEAIGSIDSMVKALSDTLDGAYRTQRQREQQASKKPDIPALGAQAAGKGVAQSAYGQTLMMNEMLKLATTDTAALEREIDQLRQQQWDTDYDATDHNARVAHGKFLEELDRQIAKKETLLKNANSAKSNYQQMQWLSKYGGA